MAKRTTYHPINPTTTYLNRKFFLIPEPDQEEIDRATIQALTERAERLEEAGCFGAAEIVRDAISKVGK